MLNWLGDHKSQLILATGVVLFSSALYKKKKQVKELKALLTNEYSYEKIESIQFNKDESCTKAIDALRQVCRLESKLYVLSIQTIGLINKTIVHLVKDHYRRAVAENRHNRHILMNQQSMYAEECLKGIAKLEKLTVEAILEILNSINVDIETYDKSIEHWSKQSPEYKQQLQIVFNSLVVNQEDIGSTVSQDELKTILQFKISQVEKAKTLFNNIETSDRMKVVESYIDDAVELEFGKNKAEIIGSLAQSDNSELTKLADSYNIKLMQ